MALRPGRRPKTPCARGRFAKWSRRLQWPGPAGWSRSDRGPAILLALVLALAAGGAAPSAEPRGSAAADAPPGPAPAFDRPLAHAPLDTPLVLTGGFGEFRANHFHAGLDLGTGGRVGRPVYAPLAGWIERVRTSGVGYGRSLYLHAEDGRLLVFGHLDAFAPPLARYVVAVQESSGQYEQDLWLAAGRLRVTAGQRIAWTGESGAGGPHLHFEIRRGDMAYNPLRSGLAIPDTAAPILASLTLEPLDDTSYVERSAAPVTLRLGERAPTVNVVGRVRAVVAARDGVWSGVDRMVPWSLSLGFDEPQVECRFDSVSWATDMVESDLVYDTGRVLGDKGFVLWAPPGFRPRALRTRASEGEEAGTLTVRPGDPPRRLRLVARDAAGGVCERAVILQPARVGTCSPDTSLAGGRAEADSSRWFDLADLPGFHLRVTYRGAPAGSRGVSIGGRPASLHDGEWSAVVALPRPGRPGIATIPPWITGRDAAGRTWGTRFVAALRADPMARSRRTEDDPLDWVLSREALFEPAPIFSRWSGGPPEGPAELVARSPALELMPVSLPLRGPVRLELRHPEAEGSRVGLYTDDGTGWSWVSAPPDSELHRRVGETRHLGRFALFADTLAPRTLPLKVPPHAIPGPYERWALEAGVREEGSGVDVRASWFEVDGRRMPTEWDPEKSILRWRPLRAPARGAHRFAVIATDRSGNARRTTGRFIMN